jgi:hypothetical protein
MVRELSVDDIAAPAHPSHEAMLKEDPYVQSTQGIVIIQERRSRRASSSPGAGVDHSIIKPSFAQTLQTNLSTCTKVGCGLDSVRRRVTFALKGCPPHRAGGHIGKV